MKQKHYSSYTTTYNSCLWVMGETRLKYFKIN